MTSATSAPAKAKSPARAKTVPGADEAAPPADEASRPTRGAPSDARTLAERYRVVRTQSIDLVAPLEPEDCVVQTIPEVSPTKWHLAHVTWFFEEFVLDAFCPGRERVDPRYRFLFNSYYWTVGEMHGRPQRGLLSRPTLAEILDYRARVDAEMERAIEAHAEDGSFRFRVTLGLHHEQQHQELLLADVKHVFFSNPLAPAYREPARSIGAPSRAPTPPLRFIERSGGRFEIGFAGGGFAFDNESPRHAVLVGDHALASRLATNGDFLEFVRDGGYARPELWLSDGWARIRSEAWQRPLYWSEDLEREFTLEGWQPLDVDAPVAHVSFYEADAFARWAGARLPTEAEWELAAAPRPVCGNTLQTGALRPLRVGSTDPGAADEPAQLFGDVWEWTASPYVAYPGFRPLDGSLGEYNGKFMANQIVVRGGSCLTPADHLRATYRSFFYPHDRWQCLGFRLARDA